MAALSSAFLCVLLVAALCIAKVTAGTSTAACQLVPANYNSSLSLYEGKSRVSVQYAQNFKIAYGRNYKVAQIRMGEGTPDLQYLFVRCGTPVPTPSSARSDGIPLDLWANATLVYVPVRAVASLETTFHAMVAALGEAETVVAVDNAQGVSTPSIMDRVAQGLVADLCSDVGGFCMVNVTAIAASDADAVLTGSYARDAVLLASGSPLPVGIVVNEVTETHPLGRAEWMKLVAAALDKETAANTVFAAIEADYRAAAALVENIPRRPVVVASRPYFGQWVDDGPLGTWYVPGGHSYVSRLIQDAGGEYPWANTTSTGTVPVRAPLALSIAARADVWINTDLDWTSLDDARTLDGGLYENMTAVRCGRVYNRDARMRQYGNDVFETGVVMPNLVLRDLIKIFHPTRQLAPFQFYRQIPPRHPTLSANDTPACYAFDDPILSSSSHSPILGYDASSLSNGQIAGIVVGCAVFAAGVSAVVAFMVGRSVGLSSTKARRPSEVPLDAKP